MYPLPFRAVATLAVTAFLGGVFDLSAQSPSPATPPVASVPSPSPTPGMEVSTVPAASEPPIRPSSASMEATFDFLQGVVLLDVDISGGHIVKLALDTGDEASVLDLDVAKDLKLPFDQLPASVLNIPKGQGPDISTPQIIISESKFGTGDFFDKTFLILPLKDDLAAMGITCQGTIGYRFFEDQVIQIDYPARKLRLLPAAPTPPPGAVVLPMQWKRYDPKGVGVLTTDQLRLGDHPLVAQFDTLFARTVILFTTKLPWLESKRLPDLPSAYYEQGILRAALPLLPVSLGDHALPPGMPAFLADKDAHTPTTDIAAILGNTFFLDAVVTLDYKHDQIFVEWPQAPK